MAVVDDASQLLTRQVKRSYRDVAQAAVSQAFPSAPPKSVPQNSVDDSMILSYKTAGWSHVGKQRFDASDEMDPVNFLSHQDYSVILLVPKNSLMNRTTESMRCYHVLISRHVPRLIK
jgi:hypothetical protein